MINLRYAALCLNPGLQRSWNMNHDKPSAAQDYCQLMIGVGKYRGF